VNLKQWFFSYLIPNLIMLHALRHNLIDRGALSKSNCSNLLHSNAIDADGDDIKGEIMYHLMNLK